MRQRYTRICVALLLLVALVGKVLLDASGDPPETPLPEAMPCAGRSVYLDDLTPTAQHVGYGDGVGTHGQLGFEGRSVVVRGVPYAHALSMHPPPSTKGEAYATFNLQGSAHQTFSASVAINDNNNFFGRAGSDLYFSVLADDGRVIWTSTKGIRKTGVVERAIEIDIASVRGLRLTVRAEGSNSCAHAVFLDPVVCTSE